MAPSCFYHTNSRITAPSIKSEANVEEVFEMNLKMLIRNMYIEQRRMLNEWGDLLDYISI